jgi:hypothetical protein
MDPPPSETEEESVATLSYNAWNKGIDQLGWFLGSDQAYYLDFF